MYDGHLLGIVASDEVNKTTYIAFRSTVYSHEISDDLAYAQDMVSGNETINMTKNITTAINDTIQIHSGFEGIWQDIKKQVYEGISSSITAGNNGSLCVAGHSLGAAVATISAFHFIYDEQLPPQTHIVTAVFGCPRVGNSEFADYMNQLQHLDLLRIVNSTDVFCDVPLSVMPNFCDISKPYSFTHTHNNSTFTKQMHSLFANHHISLYLKQMQLF